MSDDTRHLLHTIRQRLQDGARRITLASLLRGALLVTALVGALLLVLISVEALLWVPATWRSLLFWLLVAAAGILAATLIGVPILRLTGLFASPSDRFVARQVSARHPHLEDRLINLLDLGEGRASQAPDPLLDAAVRMLHGQVKEAPLEDAVSLEPARRAGRLASMPVVGLLIFLLVVPSTFRDASQRLLSPGKEFPRPAPFAVAVTPGDITIVRGDALSLIAEMDGISIPTIAELQISRARPVDLTATQPGRFEYQMTNVREGFRYRFKAKEVTTPWFNVTVIARPLVRGLQVELTPPAYTGLPVRALAPGTGDVVALPGTKAAVRIRAGGARAALVFASGHTDTLTGSGGVAKGTFTVQNKDSYNVLLENEAGIRNADPIQYQITPLTDLMPQVQIIDPPADATLTFDLGIAVRLHLSDDFGFRDLVLWWRLAESRFNEVMPEPKPLPLPLVRPRTVDQEVDFYWDLKAITGIDIVPGDVFEYYAQVRDNDAVAGFKAARSAVHRLRLPSASERYDQFSISQEETESEMAAMLEESSRIREEFENVRDELRRKQDGDWDDRRQLERVAEAQRSLEERVERLGDSMEEAQAEMQDLLSDETLQLFDEVRKVTEEINSPELMQAMELLQQAIEELNPQQMQQALEKYGFNEEMYRDRLERALELFKNLQVQQKLEAASERAEDLAETQEQQADQIEDDPEGAREQGEAMAEEQRQSKEEMERLEAAMEEIVRQMEEIRNAPADAMEQLSDKAQSEELPRQMEDNARQMESGQMQQAQQGQRQMQASLEQLQQRLGEMLSGMQGNQMQINGAALQRIVSDILLLSHDQEAVRHRVEAATAVSPLLRDFAQQQSVMRDGLRMVADSLQSLARQVPQMTREVQARTGTAIMAMEHAISAMVARNSMQAAQDQQTAMTNLNELALLLSDLLDQLMNAANNNSAGGMTMSDMIQQMQEMASQQQALNEQIQEMLGQMQGQRLTPDMQARMQQLASQQQALKEQLEALSENGSLARQLAGDLDKIAAQMEETIQELGSLAAGRELRERQQQILTRLLDASRALQERGKERRREGQTGQAIDRAGPDALDGSTPEEVLRQALLDALESGYAPDYQALIRRYFQLLQQRR